VPLKDDFDEWLARVVCFAFSVPPTAFHGNSSGHDDHYCRRCRYLA